MNFNALHFERKETDFYGISVRFLTNFLSITVSKGIHMRLHNVCLFSCTKLKNWLRNPKDLRCKENKDFQGGRP